MSHATPETLSAYLDRELDDAEAREVADHLESCDVCRDRYSGLQQVVSHLRRLDPPILPPTLDQAVARRIALDAERKGLLDRFEVAMAKIPRQSSIFALFAVVIALAVILYLFSVAVERSSRSDVRVIFADPTAETPTETTGRTFLYEGDLWVEEGVDADAVTRELTWDSDEAQALLAADPALADLEDAQGMILALGGEVVLVRNPSPDREN